MLTKTRADKYPSNCFPAFWRLNMPRMSRHAAERPPRDESFKCRVRGLATANPRTRHQTGFRREKVSCAGSSFDTRAGAVIGSAAI